MLDSRFKSFMLVSSFIGKNQVVSMVEEYDRWHLLWMLLKCHNVFHHVLEFEIVVDQLNDEDFCFDIFKMTIRTTKKIKELMNRELSMF
jgi:malate synthase